MRARGAKSSGLFPPKKPQNVKAVTIKESEMKAEFELSKLTARKNPYASKLKKPVTMRLSEDVVTYFKSMAGDAGVPSQS